MRFDELTEGDVFDTRDGRLRMCVDGHKFVFLPAHTKVQLLMLMEPEERVTHTKARCPDLTVHRMNPEQAVDRVGS